MSRVPLWRDAPVPLGRVINYRVVWAALALIVGIDSISIALSKGDTLGMFRVVLPAALCAAGSVFALWQLWLVAVAARRSLRNGGSPRVALLVLAGAALAAAAVVGILYDKAVPQLMEMWDIDNGDAKMADLRIVVADDARTLIVDGTLGIDAATRIKDALDAHPGIRTVAMGGPGGRVGPAYQIYQLIASRRLETRAEGACFSACTIMFLGGVRRSLAPFSYLGFHRLKFPGMDEAELGEANRQLRDFMVFRAGINVAFVGKVMDTPHESIWIPTFKELLDAGVIHGSDARRN
jgi:hypothetical protein